MKDIFARFRLLPLLVLVAALALVVRVGETVSGVRDLAASAIAAEEHAKDNTHKEVDAPFHEAQPVGEHFGGDDMPQPSHTANLPEVWADPAQQDMADTPEQLRLHEDLAKRRLALDAREKALSTREALLKASERQIDDKISELTQLKTQIEQLLGQQDVEEKNRIQSLVKVYQGMKPKDAATIFNQMEMPVLLKVVSSMSERKLAPIVAAMDVGKANELTVQLTELRKLPESKKDDPYAPNATAAPPGAASLPGLDALGR